MTLSVHVCGCMVGLLAVGIPLSAQRLPADGLTVRIYDAYGVGSQELRSALDVAGALFDTTGVALRWRECRPLKTAPVPAIDRCGDVLHANEVVVRLIANGRETAARTWAFGYSLVDQQTRTGTLSTVFGDHVATVAARLRVDGPTLLGRVIAHEVGHLLLGTTSHSGNGLMRAHWPDRLLRAGQFRDWQFSPDDVRQLGPALQARATLAPTRLAALLAYAASVSSKDAK